MLAAISLVSLSRGLLGMAVLIGIAWLVSSNRKKINWSLVGKGLLMQLIFAFLILYVPAVEAVFAYISKMFIRVIGFTQDGTNFLFGSLSYLRVDSSQSIYWSPMSSLQKLFSLKYIEFMARRVVFGLEEKV